MKYFLSMCLFLVMCTILPAQWQSVSFNDAGWIYSASSELEKPDSPVEIGRYSPYNLFDHDPRTSWVEGEKGSGTASYVLIGFCQGLKDYLIVYNGYQQSGNLFKKNNRVKDVKLALYAGFYTDEMAGQSGFEAETMLIEKPVSITFKDTMGYQRFKLPFNQDKAVQSLKEGQEKFAGDFPSFQGALHEFFFIRLEIESVYPGTKWDDTCIAGIEFTDNPRGLYLPVNQKITGLYQKEDEGSIYLKTSSGDEFTLVDSDQFEDKSVSLDTLDVSPGNEWAVIAYMQGGSSGSRVEEVNTLWSLRRMEKVSSDLLSRYNADSPLAFIEKGKSIYLEAVNGITVPVEDIALDLDKPRF